LVKSSGGTYAIPVIHTVETLEMETTEIKTIQDKRVIVLREEVIPVFNLAELLGKKREDDGLVEIVIVDVRDKKIALEIQKVIGQQEVAIKSLGEFLKFTKGFSGVTILGDGKISLIVDIPALL
jgi:two-component system chemotaxis sensor kinase CheA